jgi:hypothetical protein
MTVQVENEFYHLLFANFFDIIFNSEDLRLLIRISLQPASIEIESCKVPSIISKNDAIYINHWNDIDVKSPSQKINLD